MRETRAPIPPRRPRGHGQKTGDLERKRRSHSVGAQRRSLLNTSAAERKLPRWSLDPPRNESGGKGRVGEGQPVEGTGQLAPRTIQNRLLQGDGPFDGGRGGARHHRRLMAAAIGTRRARRRRHRLPGGPRGGMATERAGDCHVAGVLTHPVLCASDGHVVSATRVRALSGPRQEAAGGDARRQSCVKRGAKHRGKAQEEPCVPKSLDDISRSQIRQFL